MTTIKAIFSSRIIWSWPIRPGLRFFGVVCEFYIMRKPAWLRVRHMFSKVCEVRQPTLGQRGGLQPKPLSF